MRWKFDCLPGAYASRTQQGVEIGRTCAVFDIPVTNGSTGTDPEVLMKVEADPGFTNAVSAGGVGGYGALYPTTNPNYAGATLQDVRITSRTKGTNAGLMLVYRRLATPPGGSGSASTWTLTKDKVISHINTNATSDGTQIKGWWKKNEPDATTAKPVTGASDFTPLFARMRINAVLKVTGLLTRADWFSFKALIEPVEECISDAAWGSDPAGRWFFAGATSSTPDLGTTFAILMTFLQNKKGFFPIGDYFDDKGVHPIDSTPESVLDPIDPPEGGMLNRNGIVKPSLYTEANFSVFPFTPDDA